MTIREDPDAHGARVADSIEGDPEIRGRPADLPDPEDLEAGYELSDLSVSGAVKGLIGLGIFAFLVFVAITGYQALELGELGDFQPPPNGPALAPANAVPQVIQSRADTGEAYRELRAQEDAWLSSYGWIDEAAGTVHIPIERAMELMLESGFPTRDGESGLDEAMTQPQDSSSGRTLESVSP